MERTLHRESRDLGGAVAVVGEAVAVFVGDLDVLVRGGALVAAALDGGAETEAEDEEGEASEELDEDAAARGDEAVQEAAVFVESGEVGVVGVGGDGVEVADALEPLGGVEVSVDVGFLPRAGGGEAEAVVVLGDELGEEAGPGGVGRRGEGGVVTLRVVEGAFESSLGVAEIFAGEHEDVGAHPVGDELRHPEERRGVVLEQRGAPELQRDLASVEAQRHEDAGVRRALGEPHGRVFSRPALGDDAVAGAEEGDGAFEAAGVEDGPVGGDFVGERGHDGRVGCPRAVVARRISPRAGRQALREVEICVLEVVALVVDDVVHRRFFFDGHREGQLRAEVVRRAREDASFGRVRREQRHHAPHAVRRVGVARVAGPRAEGLGEV
mmetsp:Transcript_28269/g.86657  ORF Transcript_28269/g.86657 Transcript_28269/m.86657 type:complete len:383 (-) Transcript_28269:64-1212(-)